MDLRTDIKKPVSDDGFEDKPRNASPTPGVSVSRPERLATPLVFASPHSGRDYPPDFVARSALTIEQLRRSEDAYVDELFECVAMYGAPLVKAHFPRVYLDPNRGVEEIDSQLFLGRVIKYTRQTTPRARAGLGIVPRLGADGRAIYRARLPYDEAEHRIAEFYTPYHAAIEAELDRAQEQFGLAIFVDAHSMPSSGARNMDVVIGDRHGSSCAPEITDIIEKLFRHDGFRTIRNIPYAGGHSTERYGRPLLNRHAIQIEINRRLYMNEDRVTRSGTFDVTAQRLRHFIETLCAQNWVEILP